jgi:pimeloyl-ACP methyl ester carboxylesterase
MRGLFSFNVFDLLRGPRLALALSAAAFCPWVAHAASDPVTADAARDDARPTRNEAVWIPSHGASMNGVMFVAAGIDPHPTALLIHGLPGNEQNLDLAQVLRRSGYNVLTFHFRGSWGSPGKFTLAGGVEDTEAALYFLEAPATIAKFHIDPKRLIVVGHSYGGFTATRMATKHREIAGLVLLAPWDPAETIAQFSVPPKELPVAAHQVFDDVDGRLGGVRDVDLAQELLATGYDWHLEKQADGLDNMPILMVTATDDSNDDKGETLRAALAKKSGSNFTTLQMTTDHPFSDHRIALEATVTRWLKERIH